MRESLLRATTLLVGIAGIVLAVAAGA